MHKVSKGKMPPKGMHKMGNGKMMPDAEMEGMMGGYKAPKKGGKKK